MLPPIPQGLVPVTSQQDAVKQRPDVPPVTPPQDSSGAGDVSLENKDSSEVRERFREEQRRRQRQQAEHEQQEEDLDGEHEEDEKEPKPSKAMSRRGVWIDIKV